MANSGTPITLIEIVLDRCPLTNGVGACGATTPCANTAHTCTSPCDYECDTESLWLANCEVPAHLYPGRVHVALTQVDCTAPRLTLGDSLPRVGTTEFCFVATRRKGDPLPGSELQRIITAQKYVQGRKINHYSGHCDLPSLDYFLKQTLYIQGIEGPAGKEKEYCIIARDPLSVADGALCPPTRELSQYTDSAGSQEIASLTLGLDLDGVQSDEDKSARPYAAIGSWLLSQNFVAGDPDIDRLWARKKIACIDGEAVRVTPEINSDISPPGWNLRLTDRGICNTPIEPHEQGAPIQCGMLFDEMHVADVYCILLTECADMAAVFINCCGDDIPRIIDFAAFEQFKCVNPEMMVFDRAICDPEEVPDLIEQLNKTFFTNIYFDSATGTIKISNGKPDPDRPVHVITDADYEEGSLDISSTGERYSRVLYKHSPHDWTQAADGNNLRGRTEQAQLDSYLPTCARREYASIVYHTIETAWITPRNEYLAYSIGAQYLRYHRCPPRETCMRVDASFLQGKRVGDHVTLEFDCLRNGVDGEYLTNRWLITGFKPVEWGRCINLYLWETPHQEGDVLCLSCDHIFPEPADDACAEDCLEVC